MTVDESIAALLNARQGAMTEVCDHLKRLERELATCEAARQEELNRHRIATDVAGRMLEEYRAEVSKLIGERNAADSDARRDRNRLIIVARHLPRFVTFWLETYSSFADIALDADTQAMRRMARELMTLCEPFSE